MKNHSSKDVAREVIRIEAEAIADLEARIGDEFDRAVDIIFKCRGRVIVSGLGKSGIIGQKIAGTLTSLGIPSVYLHPVEAAHGDLGMVRSEDVAILISKSGDTEELQVIIPTLKRHGVPIIGMTGKPESTMGQVADVVLDVGVKREACPFDLVPTSSTTATLAMGDALAISLLKKHRFSEKEYALIHPGGSIGKRLSYRVDELMHFGNEVPVVKESDPMTEVLKVMSEKNLGMTCIINEKGQLTGVLTDGDLRRLLEHIEKPRELTAHKAYEFSPRTGQKRRIPYSIRPDAYVGSALQIMEKHIITQLIVTAPDDKPVGIIRWVDISKAGIF